MTAVSGLTVGSAGGQPEVLDNCTGSKIDCLYEILKLDSFLDASISNHVSRRASIRQGSGLLVTAMEAFIPARRRGMGKVSFRSSSDGHAEEAAALNFLQAAQDEGVFFAHFPVVFGEVCAARDIPLNACLQVPKSLHENRV
eukprot:GHVS01021808.1.p2 GENE.GHVS01021808.1~~GHVS01021808.1.p2  ORF type:complete len:142 (-),score=10.68 GHVS01021808.1:297-722(-)